MIRKSIAHLIIKEERKEAKFEAAMAEFPSTKHVTHRCKGKPITFPG